jgi:hypothetical protein
MKFDTGEFYLKMLSHVNFNLDKNILVITLDIGLHASEVLTAERSFE